MKSFSDRQAKAKNVANAASSANPTNTSRFATRKESTPRPSDAGPPTPTRPTHSEGPASLFSLLEEMRTLSDLVVQSLEQNPQILPPRLRAALAALPDDYEHLLRLAEDQTRQPAEHPSQTDAKKTGER